MSGGFLTFLSPIRDLFYEAHQLDEALAALRPHLENRKYTVEERRAVVELAALIHREKRQFDRATDLYRQIEDPYQAGYCEMLRGNLHQARAYWGKMAEIRQNHWCVTLFGLICRQLMAYPTTFQVRNHLETDITNLIAAGQYDYLENLLSFSDLLIQINPETYKFLGRSLMHAGWVDRSETYLKKGQKVLPNDPEIYYHLAQFSFKKGYFEDCRVLLNQCLLISPTYTPATTLSRQLSS